MLILDGYLYNFVSNFWTKSSVFEILTDCFPCFVGVSVAHDLFASLGFRLKTPNLHDTMVIRSAILLLLFQIEVKIEKGQRYYTNLAQKTVLSSCLNYYTVVTVVCVLVPTQVF